MAKHIPYLGPREMTIVDFVQGEFGHAVGIKEFLVDAAIFIYVFGHLLLHVKLATIHLVTDHVTQVLQIVHPGEGVTAQEHTW